MENSVKEYKPFNELNIARIHVHAWIHKVYSVLVSNHFWTKAVPKWHAYIFCKSRTYSLRKQTDIQWHIHSNKIKSSHLCKEQNEEMYSLGRIRKTRSITYIITWTNTIEMVLIWQTNLFSIIWSIRLVVLGLWISLAFETRNISMVNRISTSDR